MVQIPETTYDYEVRILRAYFEQAVKEMEYSLTRLSLTEFTAAQTTATIAEIREILALLDANVTNWTTVSLEKAVVDGIVTSIASLGLAATIVEAQEMAKFSKLNRNLLKTVIADTQSDLLQVTTNMERRARVAIREATAHAMRSNMARGSVGIRTIQQDILKTLDTATKQGIIDALGRRWRPEVYAEMVARTKLFSAQREACMNDAIDRDIYYGRISKHGATDKCKEWESKVVKLVREAEGDFPFIGDLPRRDIFHVNCRHRIMPVRNPYRDN